MAAAARTRKSFFITNWFGLYSACLPACKIGAKVGKLSPRPKLFGLKFPKIVLNGIGLAELAGFAPRSLREWIPIYNKRRRGRRGVTAGEAGIAGVEGPGIVGLSGRPGLSGAAGCSGTAGYSRLHCSGPWTSAAETSAAGGRGLPGRQDGVAGSSGLPSGRQGLRGYRVSGVIGAAGLRGCRVVGPPEMSKTRSLAGLVFIFWRCRLRAPCPGSARPVRGPPS